jgi:DNA-binding NarL/FixJ family response regulator
MAVVWLIEDNPLFRRATERALAGHPGMDCPRAFERCEDALVALQKEPRPEVILLDVGLPGMDGIEGIRQIKAIAPQVCLLILTVFEDDDKIFQAVCAGASGYLLKAEPMETVLMAIEQALNGGAPMNPRVARRVLTMFSKLAPERRDYGLTERESAALELMGAGLAKKQIADRLNLNQHTVDYTMRCIYRKLHVSCAAAAVSLALRERLI